MGFYDRDYQRGGYYDRQPGFHLGGPTSLTTKLIIVMFAVYVVQLLTKPSHASPTAPLDDGWFTNMFRLYPDVMRRPWQLFQLLTYGFLHDIDDLKHIVFNMVGLWFFGRVVEDRYGRREYLSFFVAAIVSAGFVWVLGEFAANRGIVHFPPMLGASGGVVAVLILFALNYPHQTVLLMFVIPMPMWLLALILVGIDVLGAMGRYSTAISGPNVAFTAHLGGAMFAFLYYQWNLRLERWLPSGSLLERMKPKPKLRVHDPESAEETDRAVDDILKKIQEHGRDSLSRRERKILEEASREYQKRRH